MTDLKATEKKATDLQNQKTNNMMNSMADRPIYLALAAKTSKTTRLIETECPIALAQT